MKQLYVAFDLYQVQTGKELQDTKARLAELETKQKQADSDLVKMKSLLASTVKQVVSLGK